MNIADLQIFLRVTELGSLSAVARERNAPVSQISRALTRLEEHHGVRLLLRSTHGLSLTAEGMSLMDHGRRVLGTLDELDAEIAQHAGEVRGVVRVGASSMMAQYLIVPSLKGLRERHPGLSVDLQVDDRVVDMVHEGIDVTIRSGSVQGDTLVAREIGSHRRHLYATPRYLKRHGTPRHPADLARHQLITNSVAPHLNQWPFQVEGKPMVVQATGHLMTNSTGIMMTMALDDLGIVRAMDAIAGPLQAQGLLKTVLESFVDVQPVPIYAVMLQGRNRAPKVRACVDYWVDWFARLQNP
jgi:DNA-binding transcriptional LysR family regulator